MRETNGDRRSLYANFPFRLSRNIQVAIIYKRPNHYPLLSVLAKPFLAAHSGGTHAGPTTRSMSTPVGALGASTSNIPSKRKRKNNQRILSDSEGTSEREDIQAADAQAKGAAAEPEPPSSKDKKRRRKKRRRQSIVDNAEGLRAQVSSMPSPNVPRIKPRSATAKKAKTPVAGPSNANVRPSTPAIASSPPARAASPELLASPSQVSHLSLPPLSPLTITQPSTSSLKGKGKPMESDDLTEQIDVSVLSAELADLKAQLAAQKQVRSHP